MNRTSPQNGLSLIELMIALAISVLLLLGLVQVFSASRASYMLAQGMARTQENGRFAMEFIQRDARMAGHFGCKSDQSLFLSSMPSLRSLFLSNSADYTTLPTTTHGQALAFDQSIAGYEASNTAPGNTMELQAKPAGGGASDWLPELNPTLQVPASEAQPVKNSDVLILRFLSPNSATVSAFEPDTTTTPAGFRLRLPVAEWNALGQNATQYTATSTPPGLLAIADCRMALLFQADSVSVDGTNAVINVKINGLNQSGLDARDQFDPGMGQIRLYRAESVAYYVGLNPTNSSPTLYRLSFNTDPGGTAIRRQVDEIAPGVESLQLLWGRDASATAGASAKAPPSGLVDSYVTGANVGSTDARANWQRVGAVKVGLLMRSPDPATSTARADGVYVLGTKVAVPNDGRYRFVYETNIALRNRLYGN
ncbi:PilW family protein [Pseudomonas sp. CGJS7]|uniref:PilW family protein n=1 Tax=Pseudomonas sp. CGJS7 TaxID=3109348 RepID=UPI00300BB16F